MKRTYIPGVPDTTWRRGGRTKDPATRRADSEIQVEYLQEATTLEDDEVNI